jgi:protease-4
MSITASIGVIMQTFTFDQLAEKVGLKFHTFKSGKYKDLLNPAREPTPEEVELVNNLIMEIYNKFVGVVAQERDIDVEKLENGIADGRILSGEQAKAAGLIDETGYFDDAVAVAEDYARIESAQIVRYVLPFSLRNLFRFLGENDRTKVQINIGNSQPHLENGKFYLLPPYMFR